MEHAENLTTTPKKKGGFLSGLFQKIESELEKLTTHNRIMNEPVIDFIDWTISGALEHSNDKKTQIQFIKDTINLNKNNENSAVYTYGIKAKDIIKRLDSMSDKDLQILKNNNKAKADNTILEA